MENAKTVADELNEALQHIDHAFFACIGNEELRAAIYKLSLEAKRLQVLADEQR